MFTVIQANEYKKFSGLLDQMFKLRKKTFVDQLQWAIEATGEYERDQFDDLKPAYLVWCSDDCQRLYGSIRLMPTTGPTLLHEVFFETIPDGARLEAPTLWETTRFCIDQNLLSQDLQLVNLSRAYSLIILALCEVCVFFGIKAVVGNYEPHVMRIYKRAGLRVEELGRADGYGKYPVCCGLMEMSEKVVLNIREKLGIDYPLYVANSQIQIDESLRLSA